MFAVLLAIDVSEIFIQKTSTDSLSVLFQKDYGKLFWPENNMLRTKDEY